MIIAIIDADGLIYHSLRETLEESLSVLNDKVENIFIKTGCSHYIMFISKGKYFRHEIDKNYKINREKYRDQQSWIKTLKGYLEDKYKAQYMIGVEADDLVCYWYNNKSTSNNLFQDTVILCSPDKDLLQTAVGKHFNYSYKLEDKNDPNSLIKGWWVENTEAQSDDFKRMQLIVGDSTDGVAGLVGKGIKFYEKISKEVKPSWGDILQLYCSDYGFSRGIFEFQKNFRLLHILETNEDFMREVGRLPDPPLICDVIINKKEEIKDNF